MNLFLNAILESGIIILFNDKREIINSKEIQTIWNESEKLLWFLDDFLKTSNLNYSDLENIVVVAGPGSFTWIRTINLLVNTINFVTQKNITPISLFELYDNYPIIKASSKRDSFFQKNKNLEIEVLKNDEIINYLQNSKIEKLFWENKNLSSPYIQIFENVDYSAIIKNIEFRENKLIDPIYIKKPSIS